MKIDVIQGEIVINHLTLIHDERSVKIIEGDLRSKYAEISAYSGGYLEDTSTYEASVYIGANEYTKKVHPQFDSPTEIVLNLTADKQDHHWMFIAHTARYSLYICAWRHPVRDLWNIPHGLATLELVNETPITEEDLPLETS